MATYDSLTVQQQADVAAFDKYLRGLFSSLSKVFAAAQPDVWVTFSSTNVDPLTATLDSGTIVPNSTNLAGAKDLTADEFLALQALAVQLMTIRNNNLALLVKAVGINA